MSPGFLSHLPSIPYPASQAGRWAPVTSTINWCEEDYYATIYSAEFVNTLTNLLFMYLAAKGIHSCVKNNHDKVFIVSYIGYLATGIGSFFFHSTLKYPMQLVDELSMIYTTCLMNYATFSFSRSLPFRLTLASSLTFLALFITLYYHYLQDPTFHQTTYAILTVIVFFRAVWVMESSMRPRLKRSLKRSEGKNLRLNGAVPAAESRTADQEFEEEHERNNREWIEDERDRAILKQMWIMIAWGLSIFLGGFLLWHLDRVHCSTLRQWRHQIGMPWGFLLELHGWWHIMTGTGGYFYIVWCIWLRHCLNGKQEEYKLVWPHFWSMPVVSLRQHSDPNGYIDMKIKQT
ncbi:alkaline ceramidase-like protein [Periconia macrospinosa]|uniref:Alkaline ceramidase-like protein n=1 Tax=Periconia macrospinosa TaxID=97972 RepID=A0A2V1EBN3_9PLEO|nr:alkaline ceramidase-like protein [Periconia macrospinosa]